jgi:hypothetical protein
MAPSTQCSRDPSRWFRTPWEFSEPLQKNLQNLALSLPEHGDDGEAASSEEEHVVEHAPGSNGAPNDSSGERADHDADLGNIDGPELDGALQRSERLEYIGNH